MKISVLKPIALSLLASAVMTACSSGGSDDGGKPTPKSCTYNIQGGNSVDIMFGTAYTNPSVSVTQEGKSVAYEVKGSVDTSKLGKNEITYSSESCSNEQVRTVNVVPSSCSYKLIGATTPLEIALNSTYVDQGVEVKDINNKVIEYKTTGFVDTTKEDEYTLSYQGVGCENSQERVVKVKAETTACKYELKGNDDLVIALNGQYTELGVSVLDAENKKIEKITISGDTVDTTVAKNYEVSYQGEGCSNNIKRTVTVKAPTECTYKLVDGDKPYTLVEGEDYKEPGCTVEDSIDKTVTECTSTNTIEKDKIGEYKVTYQNAGCNNTIIRTVNVVAPECTYTFNPDNTNSLVIYKGDTYDASTIKPVVKGTDNNEISADKVKVKSDSVDTTKKGEYETIYKAEGCPNTITRQVNVELPNCTYLFPDDKQTMDLIAGQNYVAPTVSIKDMTDIDVKVLTGTVNKDVPATYTMTYGAEGNCANTANFIVNVKKITDEELKILKDEIGKTILPKI